MGATRKRRDRAFFGVLALLLALGLVGACAKLVGKPTPKTFSHAAHIEEGLGCKDCHGNIVGSASLRERVPPSKDACADCHEDGEADEVYAAALASPRSGRIWVPSFSHTDHLEVDELGGDCTRCHQMTGPSGSAQPLRHRTCMACHREEYRDASCAVCHGDFAEDGPVPALAFSHQGDFERRHAAVARGNEGVCDHCHRESDCATCHSRHIELVPSERESDRVEARFIHRAGFEVRHAMEARVDQARCLRCHRVEQCSDCHTSRGVAQGGGRASHHPAGWMDPSKGSFHGRKARREIALCASCHDQGPQSNCVTCHKPGGVGGNPHPPGWDSRIDEGSPACTPCHR